MVSEERKQALALKLNKLEAYHEIQNEMGRCTAAFNFHQKEDVISYFALEEDDVSLEIADEGRFIGKQAVLACIELFLGEEAKPGEMIDMQLTTPIIEVADDVETAKCVWWMPGAGSIIEHEEAKAIWNWGEVAVDFKRIDNAWKIWHLHYFRLIKCDYQKGWVKDTSMIHRPNTPMHPLSLPSSYHNPYSPLSIRDGLPCAPRPYQTYDDEDWCLNKDKR